MSSLGCRFVHHKVWLLPGMWLALIVVLLPLLVAAPASAQSGSGVTIDEFPVSNVFPANIAAGPDGNIWFTQWGSTPVISRITTDGVITQWPTPNGPNTGGITAGSDGNVWFAEVLYGGPPGGNLAKITPAGVLTEYPIPTQSQFSPLYVAADEDGNIWYTAGGPIGKFNIAAESFTQYQAPVNSPHGITVGPDGNIWWADYGGNFIGKMTPSGECTVYPCSSVDNPYEITTGADGNLWFAEYSGLGIGRITTDGVITEFPLPSGYGTHDVALGPDGNIWFTEYVNNKIGMITTTGQITEYDVPTAGSTPSCITAGSDGNIWFTERYGMKIGRLTLNVDTTPPVITITSPAANAQYVTGQVVKAAWTVDDSDAVVSSPVPLGSPIDTSLPGIRTFTVKATDAAGNEGSATVSYTVLASTGVTQPVNPDGTSVFKLKSTIPIKIALTNAGGLPVTGLHPTITWQTIGIGGEWVGVDEAISTNKPDSGNVMRETAPGVYMFNLSARSLGTNKFRLVLDLGNGGIVYSIFAIEL